MGLQRFMFTLSLGCASRLIQLRDRSLRRVSYSLPECPGVSAARHAILSGRNRLDAIYAKPAAEPACSAVLICHGIGEVAPQWFPIQRLLAKNGIASLVFDYSGYGRSTGLPDWRQCEQDAVAAFHLLQSLTPAIPISLLGFSLGTGIASAILNRVTADRLVLCAAYTSFRNAARAAWIPAPLTYLVPPIWSAEHTLRSCSLPVLIVHGDRDGLFPIQMARDLVSYCGGRAEIIVLPARSHNEPFYNPQMHYWGPIANWLLAEAPRVAVAAASIG